MSLRYPRRVPVRTCVVCGRKTGKYALRRLAVNPQQCIVLDVRQRMAGRGAYVCPECLPKLRFSNRLQKAFKGRAKELTKDILRQLSNPGEEGITRDSKEWRFDISE